MSAATAQNLDSLRARIRGLERLRPVAWSVGLHPEIDPSLPGNGLAGACLHQIMAGAEDGAATAFAARIAGRLAERFNRPVLWAAEAADLYSPGLGHYGLSPQRLLQARASCPADLAWIMEEALKCPDLACVIAELPGLDLVAGRRLQLAAEAGGVTGLALHPFGAHIANAGTTRWRISGHPNDTWRVILDRCRNGLPGEWEIVP